MSVKMDKKFRFSTVRNNRKSMDNVVKIGMWNNGSG